MAQPRRAGSSGFCPPPGARRLRPMKAMPASRYQQPQFAQRVSDPYTLARRVFAARPVTGGGDAWAALRMARSNDGQQTLDGPPPVRDGRQGSHPPRPDGCWRRARPAVPPPSRAAVAIPPRPPAAVARQASGRPACPRDSSRDARSRSASVALRGCTCVNPPSICRASPGMRRHRARLRSDRRALISIMGMPRARQAASRFGHSSLSTKPATSGRQ